MRLVAAFLALLLPAAGGRGAAASDSVFLSRTLAPDPLWQATSGGLAGTGRGLSGALGNPAAVARLSGRRAAVSHLVWAEDLSREWLGLGGPVGGRWALLLDASMLHGPALQGFDAEGRRTGTFDPSEWNSGITASAAVGRGLDLGVGARYFRLEDPADPVGGWGLSAGAWWALGPRGIGLSVTDLGSVDGSASGSYSLPTRWRAGVEQTFEGGSVAALTLEGGESDALRLSAGVIVRPLEWVSLLGGVSSGQGYDGRELGWSTGLSIEGGGVIGSYAYREAGELAATHQFGVEIPLGR